MLARAELALALGMLASALVALALALGVLLVLTLASAVIEIEGFNATTTGVIAVTDSLVTFRAINGVPGAGCLGDIRGRFPPGRAVAESGEPADRVGLAGRFLPIDRWEAGVELFLPAGFPSTSSRRAREGIGETADSWGRLARGE